jgi:hypothetical protein
VIPPFYQDESVSLYHSDCLDVLREMPDASVDAVVTDPPYSLTDGGKQDCASDTLRDAIVADAAHGEAECGQGLVKFRITLGGSGATVRGRGIDLDYQIPAGEQEVRDEGTTVGQRDDVLVHERDTMPSQEGSRSQLRLWVRQGGTRCIGACRCLGKDGAGLLRVPVRLDHDPFGQAEGSAGVVAFPGTEVAAVLALDMRRRTGELLPASGADALDPPFHLLGALPVGAGAGAGGLPSVAEPGGIGEIGDTADRAVTFDLVAHAVVLSWRPISLRGFMSSQWDGTGIETDIRLWRECLRVMKPGAHLLAFGGTRTWHRLTCAIEDAGFEIRDNIADLGGGPAPTAGLVWLHGQGFSKGRDFPRLDYAANGDHENAAKWAGWNVALKPAFEPVVVARKPLAGTIAQNVLTYGTGAINIDGCRVEPVDRAAYEAKCASVVGLDSNRNGSAYGEWTGAREDSASVAGRWPPNVVLDGDAAQLLDQQSGTTRDGVAVQRNGGGQRIFNQGAGLTREDHGYGGEGGASRFFKVIRESPSDLAFLPVESETWQPPGDGSTTVANTFAGKRQGSSGDSSPTAGSGSKPTDPSPTATRSTTGTTTPSTTTCPTSCASQPSGTTTTTSGCASSTCGSTESSTDGANGAAPTSRPLTSPSDEPAPSTATAAPAPSNIGASGSPATGKSSTPSVELSAPLDSTTEFPVFRYETKAPTSERPRVPGETGDPVLRLRGDLTDEECVYVLTELERAGVDVARED